MVAEFRKRAAGWLQAIARRQTILAGPAGMMPAPAPTARSAAALSWALAGQADPHPPVERATPFRQPTPEPGSDWARRFGLLLGEARLLLLTVGPDSSRCEFVELEAAPAAAVNDNGPLQAGAGGADPSGAAPMLDCGSESIIWSQQAGRLSLGPLSARNLGGPAFTGRGGSRPTFLDAQLLLGRLNPAVGTDPRHHWDWTASRKALEPVAHALGESILAVAARVNRLSQIRMADMVWRASIERDADLRDYTLLATGPGVLLAVELAEHLGLNRVVVPAGELVRRLANPTEGRPLERPRSGLSLAAARRGHREVHFERDGKLVADVYDACLLEPGTTLAGPAVVQDDSQTLLVTPGSRLIVDQFGNFHVLVRSQPA